ncbi:MAG TPA: hypothetical protein VKB93_12360 [Thermoanaerobaculia bacterium]|nr:hypothetical protein [Thermoanaerobaculia bacterium]
MTRQGRSLLLLFLFLCSVPAFADDDRITQLETKLDELARQMEEIREELRQLRPAAADAAPAEDLTKVDIEPSVADVKPVENQVSPGAAKALNPDISVLGTFVGHAGDRNEFEDRPNLGLDEAEVAFEAFIDPYAKGRFFVSVGPDEVELEEGYAQFVTLPWGLTAKAGKTKAMFGKANTWHTHTRPWVDQPLMITRFFGDEGLADVGVSVSKQIDNPFGAFLEATGEIYNDNFYNTHLKFFRDLTENSNIEVGASAARGGEHGKFGGVDVTYRWKPLQRSIYNSMILRFEGLANRPVDSGNTLYGYYASADYQLGRRWFTGARFDRADRERALSATLTFWPSEFSQLRGQYRRTRLIGGAEINEFLLQLQFAIGAHGAHTF